MFTFDSLGGQHPAVGNRLKEYLRCEALDKKEFTTTRNVTVRAAKVRALPRSSCQLTWLCTRSPSSPTRRIADCTSSTLSSDSLPTRWAVPRT